MRRLARTRAALGLALAIALVLPAGASAGGGFDLRFEFRAGDGYKIAVGGYDATAILTASRSEPARGRRAWSTYVARGEVGPTAIHAAFGALGRVDMRFRPSGPASRGKRHRHCIGADRYTIRPGVFVGSLRFRGEDGYVSTSVHRVKGKVVTPRFLRCFDSLFEELEARGGGHGAKKRPKVTRLFSFMRTGLTAILFAASERGGKTGFVAEMEQTVGSLGVFRGVTLRASPATFAFDSSLSSAGVTPPAPFSGSATLQRGPAGAKALTGPLAVTFLGAPDVPLTGPRFKTQLIRSW